MSAWPQSTSAVTPGAWICGTNTSRAARPRARPSHADVIADRRLGDLDAMLVDQSLPHALGGVALLARRAEIGHKPLVDELAVLAQLRRRPLLG